MRSLQFGRISSATDNLVRNKLVRWLRTVSAGHGGASQDADGIRSICWREMEQLLSDRPSSRQALSSPRSNQGALSPLTHAQASCCVQRILGRSWS